MTHAKSASKDSGDTEAICKQLPWDSEFFGFPIARLFALAPSKQQIAQAVQWCSGAGIRCLYFLCEAEAVASAQAASRQGFDLIGMRVTMRWSDGKAAKRQHSLDPAVRLATPADHSILKDMAVRSFRDTRFYEDTRFPRESADALYCRWVERDLTGEKRFVIVSEHAGHVSGFASGSVEEAGSGLVGLVAVSEKVRGKGVGGILIDGLLRTFQDRGATNVVVVTAGRNVPAIRLYESRGFRIDSIQLWFHKWFGPDLEHLDSNGVVRKDL